MKKSLRLSDFLEALDLNYPYDVVIKVFHRDPLDRDFSKYTDVEELNLEVDYEYIYAHAHHFEVFDLSGEYSEDDPEDRAFIMTFLVRDLYQPQNRRTQTEEAYDKALKMFYKGDR